MEDRPVLYRDLRQDYEAFHVLSSSRPIGMGGASPIPISQIESYMRIFEITDLREKKFFIHRIRLIDHIYLDWQADKRKSKEGPKK
jgi:hypothetical protein